MLNGISTPLALSLSLLAGVCAVTALLPGPAFLGPTISAHAAYNCAERKQEGKELREPAVRQELAGRDCAI